MANKSTVETDVILIGAGIMSATLGMLLKQLNPALRIEIVERLDSAAAESSDAWNNAGTGHSAFCELNYTPQKENGSIDISKAIKIADSFEVSKQFWAFLVDNQIIKLPDLFIKPIPHMSFVWGEKNVSYLRKRYEALQSCHLFEGMKYSEDANVISQWVPLVIEGRKPDEPIAATKMDLGTDVNFGTLTKNLLEGLGAMENVNIKFKQSVTGLKKKNNKWNVRVVNEENNNYHTISASFVFIGAGGGSLPLLLKSKIPESKGFGGFPVSGQWLRCTNPAIIKQHAAKVYGAAAVGSPPMSVPHLDTRWIKGKRELLFGPYAGFTTKFLKSGSWLDLIKSIKFSNIKAMIFAGARNLPLTKYLIDQVRLTPDARLDALREYYPNARKEDWELAVAGYRVQVIKKDEEEGGVLEFGTEVVSAADGSIAALLGASPGASTAVSIMIDLVHKCFSNQVNSIEWQKKLKEMIPSYGKSLSKDPALAQQVRAHTSKVLRLHKLP
ncbi:malate:quinone oxidoreductase [Niastella yeongjuensis]|uniref:Probable malate:quinone oxidoreductase n=1 Tax=Niastella yeongjuensis TaxID=354355 RepID=A0A1V9F4W1_9BACT|nr:malate:quinone oxidoreductase [Niastella yeongjuensis]OQP53429.1 malate:quinone oxidoreductase [Niastella yeongjuensis]SEP12510.1 malate dehydrogenase (quinone) [Niastella yeongjuensis]